MRIIFMGTPAFAVPALEMLVVNKFEVAGVYTQPDKVSGRGQTLSAPPVKLAAIKLNLPVFQPDNLKLAVEKERLIGLKPDIIIVAAYGVILPKIVLDLPAHGCINIHPSLLPKYRGVAPVPAAILNGDEFTGVSIMLLDKGIDTGLILAQAQITITAIDSGGMLMEKLSIIGAHLLLDIIPRWQKKEIVPRPQENALASYSRMIEKTDGEINWHRSALEISRQVRAYQPWPGSYTRWQGKQLKIVEAKPISGKSEVPGKVILAADQASIGIETVDGILEVQKVQLEGKRAMSGAEFIRGQKQFVGAVLPS
jgi:methionyl-tRNA formyltransferase